MEKLVIPAAGRAPEGVPEAAEGIGTLVAGGSRETGAVRAQTPGLCLRDSVVRTYAPRWKVAPSPTNASDTASAETGGKTQELSSNREEKNTLTSEIKFTGVSRYL